MEDDFSPTARKVVALYYKAHCAWYTDGVMVISNKLLAIQGLESLEWGEQHGWALTRNQDLSRHFSRDHEDMDWRQAPACAPGAIDDRPVH
jgi:hypothetical protein